MKLTSGATRSRPLRLVAAAAIAGLMATACGNSGDDDTSSPTVAGAADTAADTAAPADTGPADTAAPTDTGPTDTAGAAEPDIGTFEPISGVPGVTDETISFAVMGTGPANPLGYCLLECYKAGVQAYFDYRNSIGGVNGRQLEIGRVDDDEFANTQVKLLDIMDDDSVFATFAAPLTYSGFSDVGGSDMPLYTTFPASGDADGFDNIYVPNGTLCVTCLNPMTVWAAANAGATTAASLGFGFSQASKDCATRAEQEFTTWGPDAGIEFAYKNDDLPFGLPNGLGPEVTAMLDAGVDYITLCVDQNSALVLAQELARQGAGDVTIVLPQGYGDTGFLTANADVLEGDLLATAYRPAEADPGDSILPTMLEWLDKSGVGYNDYAIQGWLGATLAVTGILAAGAQFDRASVIAATNAITDYTGDGLLPPVDWTTAHTAPTEDEARTFCMAYLKVQPDGSLETVEDPATPFACYDLPLESWTEPRITADG
jgi:ABC-type branched-subunit amino acid transport system substrate-binding protein